LFSELFCSIFLFFLFFFFLHGEMERLDSSSCRWHEYIGGGLLKVRASAHAGETPIADDAATRP